MKSKKGLIYTIYRREDIDKIDAKINLFGINRKYSTSSFLNIRFFTSILVFLIFFFFFNNGFILAPIFTAAYYYLITYLLIEKPLKERGRKLEHEAFYYFEVLTLSLESGRNLEMAIDSACKNINSQMSSEFSETLYQVKFGKSLSEALDEMRFRIPSESVNNIILNVMQSSLFGNSILQTMYYQLDYLRDKQIMDIKAEISKIPTKISIFSVLFFVPIVLVLILAPLVLEFILI